VVRILVLGAAAGGGFPQWNSNAPGCRRARGGDAHARPRTQCSLALSADGRSWFLVNAAPDLRAQIEANPVLHPQGGPQGGLRSSPIAGVVLTGADVDAVAGLLTLRERHGFAIYALAPILAALAANPIFGVLAPDCVARRAVAPEEEFALAMQEGRDSGLRATLFPVPGKVALYLEGEGHDASPRLDTGTVGLQLREAASGATAFIIPGCAAMTQDLARRLEGAALVFFDGTLWSDDEMIRMGVGTKTGRRMGHMSLAGTEGTMAAFARLGVARKILIHINNTNPILLEDSAEHAAIVEAGWEVAYDGMEVAL
jgi:pyrroloquinoline quinone biosynthesis protein B